MLDGITHDSTLSRRQLLSSLVQARGGRTKSGNDSPIPTATNRIVVLLLFFVHGALATLDFRSHHRNPVSRLPSEIV